MLGYSASASKQFSFQSLVMSCWTLLTVPKEKKRTVSVSMILPDDIDFDMTDFTLHGHWTLHVCQTWKRGQ